MSIARLLTILLVLGAALPAQANGSLRRFALLVGVNDGGPGRPKLRYAVSDAHSFGKVLRELGGVAPRDLMLLEEADRATVERGLALLKQRVEEARRAGSRTEAIVYYSGHSDEEGLLLGRERFSYLDFRRSLQSLDADVRIAILDSCSSGTLARTKGGVRRPAFLLDASTSVRGQAILTSSAADEVSQESDRIKASYFTHHLVSGLRGAADSSRDGRVTLSEAYQFAFQETLARTERTRAGAQHPAWDIDLAGSGEVVLTDLRTTSAGLVLGEDLDGRIYVRDRNDRLVLELRKNAGERSELGLAPGPYSLIRERESGRWRAQVTVTNGTRRQVRAADFSPIATERTVSRGAGELRTVWANVSLVPPIQSNTAASADRVENHFSFGFLVARSAQLRGFGLSLVGNWIDEASYGVELGPAFNYNRGFNRGVQLAGATNIAGDGQIGWQIAGATNVVGTEQIGWQIAGGANVVSGEQTGWQTAGGANVVSGEQTGWQIAGGFNYATAQTGMQLAPINVAGGAHGLQLSVINIGGEVDGVQFGVVNVARKVKGLQFGVLNLGGEVEGESIGVLSLVRNGQLHAEAWSSDVSLANAGIKLGSRRVYTLFAAGYGSPARSGHIWTTGAGLGVHFPLGERWHIDTDASMHTVHAGDWNSSQSIAQLRGQIGYRIAGRFAVFAAPTFNVGFDFEGTAPETLTAFPGWQAGTVRLWPGLQLGIRI